MTLAILITIGLIVYLIVGRTILILLDDADLTNTEEWRGVSNSYLSTCLSLGTLYYIF